MHVDSCETGVRCLPQQDCKYMHVDSCETGVRCLHRVSLFTGLDLIDHNRQFLANIAKHEIEQID